MGSSAGRPGGVRQLPRPALKWVGEAGRVALRIIDWQTDADFICAWQRETYALNFEGFRITDAFESAFRHDLRRATIDTNHGLFVLDDGAPCGFVWAVVCQNSWTSERYGYLNNLYVVKERRSQGLAEDLLRYSDEWFKRRRVHRVRLTVTQSNEAACKLYAKSGFTATRLEMEKEI